MKQFFIFICVLVSLASGLSAGGRSDAAAASGKISVVTTIFPPYDFAREIAGDKAELTMLLPPGAESHSWDPAPRDIITIQNSSIFIYGGGESDEWVKELLSSMDTSKKTIIAMMDCVETVEEELVEGMEEEEGEEEEEAYDEHVWTSPRNVILIAGAITEALCKEDPANAALYRKNYAGYTAKLSALDDSFRETVKGGKRTTFVFADRFPFRYFADAYGLSYFAAFPGCSVETEPSAATVAFLIRKIRAEQIPAVFHIELSSERMADTISAETGAKKLLLHACHNISKNDFEKGVSYLDLMTANVKNLKEALW
jgi:zinc transport system substrate-binding protein